jgi:flagellar transcriptional activator FlhC
MRHHLRALDLARQAAAWGARPQTVARLTGLRLTEIKSLLYPATVPPRRGRYPTSADWYHWAKNLHRMEACVVMSLYSQLRLCDVEPAEALVGAYRAYSDVYRDARRIEFDRAFDLASHLEGAWCSRPPSFTQLRCDNCGGLILASAGTTRSPAAQCPLCKTVRSYPLDARIRYSLRHVARGDSRRIAAAVRSFSLAQDTSPTAPPPDTNAAVMEGAALTVAAPQQLPGR